jgi:hypothetical protein
VLKLWRNKINSLKAKRKGPIIYLIFAKFHILDYSKLFIEPILNFLQEGTMKSVRHIVFISSIVMAVTLMTSIVFAVDTELSRSTLRGIKGIRVGVEPLDPKIEGNGLTENQIQADVESKLRNAGIKVLSEEEWLEEEGFPYLYIKVIPMETYEKYFAYLEIEFIQAAILVINPGLNVDDKINPRPVVTWSVSVLGKGFDLNYIRDRIKDLVDQFLDAYLSVNPKP